jgi:hypothetical protein
LDHGPPPPLASLDALYLIQPQFKHAINNKLIKTLAAEAVLSLELNDPDGTSLDSAIFNSANDPSSVTFDSLAAFAAFAPFTRTKQKKRGWKITIRVSK